ncbi:MAG: hypothetical protein ABI947_12155 [Chloroflexota bacterium]
MLHRRIFILACSFLMLFPLAGVQAAPDLGVVMLDDKQLDLNTGVILPTKSVYQQLDLNDDIQFSPDHHHVAYMSIDKVGDTLETTTGTLFIAPVDILGNIGKGIAIQQNTPVPYSVGASLVTIQMEYEWSPNSQWLIYQWQVGDKIHYLNMVDVNGKSQFKSPFYFPNGIQFDSWSADGKYLSAFLNGRFAFIRFPNIYITYPLPDGMQPLGSLCGTDFDSGSVYCSIWSPTGHLIIFGKPNGDKAQMLIVDPDKAKPIVTVDIPAGQKYQSPIWSPDGASIALFSIETYDLHKGHIDLVNWDGTTTPITDAGAMPAAGESRPYIDMDWCDADTLFYADANTYRLKGFVVKNHFGFAVPPITPPENSFSVADYFKLFRKCRYMLQTTDDNPAILDLQTGKSVTLSASPANSFDWEPGDHAIALGDQTITWANADGSKIHSFKTDTDFVPLDWSSDGQYMIYAAPQNHPTAFHLADLNMTYRADQARDWIILDGVKGNLKAIFAPDSNSAVLTTDTQTVLYNLPDEHRLSLKMIPTLISWSPDSRYFILYDKTTNVIDLYSATGVPLKHFGGIPQFNTLTWGSHSKQ